MGWNWLGRLVVKGFVMVVGGKENGVRIWV